MSEYLIETSHTKEECLRALDEIMAKGPQLLNKFEWGCQKGNHTGWAIVEAKNEAAARELVPSFLRGKTKVVEVNRFSPEQITSLHQQMAM